MEPAIEPHSAIHVDTAGVPILFYDGTCGLCHGAVKWVLARDPDGSFAFAPLGGPTFVDRLPEEVRRSLPDSIVLLEPDGRHFVRSEATRRVLRRLGGRYGGAAGLMKVIPTPLRDVGYRAVASVRKRLAPPPPNACPIVPPEHRRRFLP